MVILRGERYEVVPARPRETVRVTFPDGRVYEGAIGTPLEAFVRAAEADCPVPVMAALVNKDLRELSYRIQSDAEVVPIYLNTSDGIRVYQRSLTLLLVTAARELFPEARIVVDHAVPLGGFFCRVEGREPLSPEELVRLEGRMRELVDADLPIGKERVPLDEARAIFNAQGAEDKVRLLAYRQKSYVTLYSLRGVRDYFYGYMVPSTGYLRVFGLRYYPPGFILQFPTRERPLEMPEETEYPRLFQVFQEYGEWMRVLGIEDVGMLNEALEAGRAREVVLVAEALHRQRVAEIARQIASQRDRIQLVLIAGPSSSGKTTFARRLAVQLLANGVKPVALEMDNYFVDREKTPLDEEGNYDFESLGALDVELFNRQLLDLMAGKEVRLPRFNFHTGKREEGEWLRIGPGYMIVAEGIHGLNPELVPHVPPERIYRIYVSALTQLNIDRHNRVPTSDTRLLRRIVRDARDRGYSARQTIERWASVRRGEVRWIFPYQENADATFNSALVYELGVLKPFVEPLLHAVEPGTLAYVEAKRLLSFLEWFLPWDASLVPDDSILREFIGGSILKSFRPWSKEG